MAFTCGFYNSVNHDRKYDAVQHGMVFDGIITDGIYATYLKAMVVKASSNPSEVIVQPGRAWFNHTWSYNDADYPVAAPDPEVVLDRIDTLVLDINSEDAVRDNRFLWVQGTPTSQIPEPPELIHTATHNQYPLCDVYRQAGTTQIYAADITNRVGTSDCPFVTGVLEGINIDDLLAQWDDEFHTWENATKASFEGWMLNQQAVYTAWWDALKTQMAGDVDDVEEWIQTIKDIIDEETATHLQLEIDEINSMLPAGSHITVTTTDTELYSRAVTITDEDNNTVTSQFDATGVAVFKSVPYVGNLTIESTDGTRTATAVVNTPYFARYEFPLAFWSATVNITGGTELGGETVTITDSSQILVGTVVLDASGAGVFNATYPDTYKFSVTHGGQTMEVSLAVTQETTYNVTIHAGFNWRGWVDTAQYLDSSDYNSLEEVLADELAVRELCLEHACVDYLAAIPSVNADIETVINNDLFAKWANNSDYSLDILGANVAIKALMDEADKYGYGEWVITDSTTTPVTWGAKGNVPVMTSATAPYGEAFANSSYSDWYPYKAFDKNDSTAWANVIESSSQVEAYLGYKFTNPVKAKRAKIRINNRATSFVIKASNTPDDQSSFVNVSEVITNEISENYKTYIIDLNTDNYYLAYEVYVLTHISGDLNSYNIHELQFYGRELSVSVPTMTGVTTPYGSVIYSSAQNGNINGYTINGYGAFDNSDLSAWANASTDNVRRCGYDFGKPVFIKFARKAGITGWYYIDTYKIQASDDGVTWVDISGSESADTVALNPDKPYRYWALQCLTGGTNNVFTLIALNFYGLDYSEKEFEEGTTKKWLYDHGVELETLNDAIGTGATISHNDSSILIYVSSTASAAGGGISSLINLTPYSLSRAKIGASFMPSSNGNMLRVFNESMTTVLSSVTITSASLPNNVALDISSINGNNNVNIACIGGISRMEVAELWLE